MNRRLTIIICTYNRGDLISETIPTIFQQDLPLNDYSVIIVNNNSDDGTAKILDSFSIQYNNLMVINEKMQGLSHAKNAGMFTAKTDWVVYLDDDAKVPFDFVRKALKNIANSNFSCFGGVYLPWYKYGKPRWYKDEYASNANKLPDFGVLQNDYISGGIMAVKKNVLLKYGGFSTNIGMKGTNTAYGEETFLQIMLRKDGYDIGYDPNWIMYHLVGNYKLQARWFLKSGYVSGRDSWIIYQKIPTIKILFLYLFRSLKMFIVNLFKYTPKIFTENYYSQNWIIDVFRPSILKFGQVIGGIKYLFKNNGTK